MIRLASFHRSSSPFGDGSASTSYCSPAGTPRATAGQPWNPVSHRMKTEGSCKEALRQSRYGKHNACNDEMFGFGRAGGKRFLFKIHSILARLSAYTPVRPPEADWGSNPATRRTRSTESSYRYPYKTNPRWRAPWWPTSATASDLCPSSAAPPRSRLRWLLAAEQQRRRPLRPARVLPARRTGSSASPLWRSALRAR